jgi:hypothetical protein
MEIVNVLKDESGQGRFGHLGGLIADGDNVYAPCGSSNTLSIVDRANTVSPFIVGSVTNNETLDRPLVPAVIRPNKLLASSVYDEDGVVLINIEDRTRPVITKYLVNEPYMDGADDLQWDEEDKRLYVTCCRSRRLAILDLELENTTTSSSSSTSSTETTSSTESTSSRTETTTTEKKGGRKKGHENPKNPHYGKDRRVK